MEKTKGTPFIFIKDCHGKPKGEIVYMPPVNRLEWAICKPPSFDPVPPPIDAPSFETHIINCPTPGILISLSEHIDNLLKNEEFELAKTLKPFLSPL